jgi:hypothetical protein
MTSPYTGDIQIDHVCVDGYTIEDDKHHVHVKCPFCGRQHQHGLAGMSPTKPGDSLGGHLSHCSPARHYNIIYAGKLRREESKQASNLLRGIFTAFRLNK